MSAPPVDIELPKTEAEDSIVEESQSKLGGRPSPRVLPLLLEVGCEEIPARFLRDAEKNLGERVQGALLEARLIKPSAASVIVQTPDSDIPPTELSPLSGRTRQVATYSTPRRLVVHVPVVSTQQPDEVAEILGPPVKVAFDSEGKYTRAAESFAQKNSAGLADLARTTTPKGEYLSLRKTTKGRPALEILPEILPLAILGMSFPKSMYWTEKSVPRFVRPIRWVLALLGEGKHAATVEFEILGVQSGNFTRGHRVTGTKPIAVSGFKNYSKKLLKAFVEIDPAMRRDKILEESRRLVENAGFKLLPDEWLADWMVNSTEWPRTLLGNFDERFLHLPREILTTVMRDHQRYFAVEQVGTLALGTPPDESSVKGLDVPAGSQPDEGIGTPLDRPCGRQPEGQAKLAPHFVAVLNMDSDEKGLIRQGHERVLTARFRDAEFFWNADQKTPLRSRIPLLDRVTFQADLGDVGSYGDKIRRMRAIAGHLCSRLEVRDAITGRVGATGMAPDGVTTADSVLKAGNAFGVQATAGARCKPLEADRLRQYVLRAVELCKCDLTTQMVQEFTELQGIVGGLYAKAQEEPEEVAAAVYDHYLPLGAEGASPRTLAGALVSLADKVDSVVAGFAVGHEPTGSSDPFALRRQANAIVKVMVEFRLTLDLKSMVDDAIAELDIPWPKPREEVRSRVLDFFAERLCFYFESVRGFRYDTVRAVVAAGADQPADAQARAEAMEVLRGGEDFEALSIAAKRIRNILAKSASAADWQPGDVNTALLSEPQEKDLFEAFATVAADVQQLRVVHQYRRALERISTLRPTVDRFFDKVLVMAEDRALRENRLRLLKKLDELFSGIAHFAEIAEKQ